MKKSLFLNIKPVRDWNILVAIFGLALIIISVVAWQVYLSNKIGGGYVSSNKSSSQTILKSIDLNKLDSAVGDVEKRSQIFNRIQSKDGQVIDPSL